MDEKRRVKDDWRRKARNMQRRLKGDFPHKEIDDIEEGQYRDSDENIPFHSED
jgi:hypothetical protein